MFKEGVQLLLEEKRLFGGFNLFQFLRVDRFAGRGEEGEHVGLGRDEEGRGKEGVDNGGRGSDGGLDGVHGCGVVLSISQIHYHKISLYNTLTIIAINTIQKRKRKRKIENKRKE